MNRKAAPEIQSIKEIITGFPGQANRLFHIPAEEGVFKLEIIFPYAGYGSGGNKFAALYAMDLLLSGTQNKNAGSIAEEIDLLGGFTFKSCDYYSSSVGIYGLNENFDPLISLVNDSINNCIYDEFELGIYKKKKLSELQVSMQKTAYLSARRINEMMFGSDHPYAIASSPSIIEGVKREDLLKFCNERLKDPYLIFTGLESIDPLKFSIAGGLNYEFDPGLSPEKLPMPQKLDPFVLKKDSNQNTIRMALELPARTNRDYFKISISNLILGGYFGSRLMKNIREDKGLTYGIHSSITPFREFSILQISSDCSREYTQKVKEEIELEIKKLQTEPISEDELMTARNYLTGSLSRSFDGPFNISERLKSALDLNTSSDYYDRYLRAINDFTAFDLIETTNNYFKLSALNYCISGEV